MITAAIAKQNTETTKTNLAQKAKERAQLFCEKKISPIITAASKNGEDHVIVDVDEDIDVNEVTINLIENRFQVSPGIKRNLISIMW